MVWNVEARKKLAESSLSVRRSVSRLERFGRR